MRVLLAGIALLIAAAAAGASAEEPPGEARLHVNAEEGTITLAAAGVPLEEILHRIKETAAFEVELYGDFEDGVSISLTDAPLEDGIRRIVGDHSVAILFEEKGENQVAGGRGRISKVWVIEKDWTAEGKEVLRAAAGEGPAPEPSPTADIILKELGYGRGTDGLTIVSEASRFNDDTAVAVLGRILESDELPEARRQALDRLEDFNSDAALTAISAGLGDDLTEMRSYTVEKLSASPGSTATQLLGQVVHSDPDPDVRELAVRGLAARNTEAARAFLAVAADDPDEIIRSLAREALNLP